MLINPISVTAVLTQFAFTQMLKKYFFIALIANVEHKDFCEHACMRI